MYEYHGWLSTSEALDEAEIESSLKGLNESYPVAVRDA
jgi:hypothetical protein